MFIFSCQKNDSEFLENYKGNDKRFLQNFANSNFLRNLESSHQINLNDLNTDDIKFEKKEGIVFGIIKTKKLVKKYNFAEKLIYFCELPNSNIIGGIIINQKNAIPNNNLVLNQGEVSFTDEFNKEYGGIRINNTGKGKLFEGKDLVTLMTNAKNSKLAANQSNTLGGCTATCYHETKNACSSSPACDMIWDLSGDKAPIATAIACAYHCVTHDNTPPGHKPGN